jgi:hypothetical protein
LSSRDLTLDTLEQRQMLAVDHPSLPSPWTPNPSATMLTPDTVNPENVALRGRAQANGQISAADPGDLFNFTIPSTSTRTRDFVTILADTTGVASATLDSLVEVYNDQGVLIASGADNGNLSVGLDFTRPVLQRTPDGWVGFEGTVGNTYYIRVRADPNPVAGRGATGQYILKIDTSAVTTAVDINEGDLANGIVNADFGSVNVADELTSLQEDIVYLIQTPGDARFDSLSSFAAIAEDGSLNPHVDVYSTGNSNGVVQRLASDTDAGRQSDSFTTSLTSRGTTYYVRVRADDLRTGGGSQSLGQFQMRARLASNEIDLDEILRQGQSGPVATGDQPTGPTWSDLPLIGPGTRAGTDSRVFRFKAEGTGLGIIDVLGLDVARGMEALPPLTQPALRLFNSSGQFLDFGRGQLFTPVAGGSTYYFVVENFDGSANGGFKLFIEGHHTYDPFVPVDDHPNKPTGNNRADWETATPIRFGDPTPYIDENGVQVRDRGWIQTGVGRGRIQGNDDTDVFQFVAPINQLSAYAGRDGNDVPGLYVGGAFGGIGANPRTGDPYESPNVGVWSGNWYNVTPSTVTGNTDPSGFDGTIRAITTWDHDGSGTTPPVIVVAGDFTTVFNPLAGGNVPLGNIAFRVYEPMNNVWVWTGNPANPGGQQPIIIDGVVNTLAVGDVRPAELQGGNSASELYVGGSFTQLGAAAVSNVGEIFFGAGAAPQFGNVGGGVSGGTAFNGRAVGVYALTIYDPPTPGAFTAPTGQMNQPPMPLTDVPASLYIGGRFLNAQGSPGVNNLARWGSNGQTPANFVIEGLPNFYNITFGNGMPGTATATDFGVTGAVLALTSWDDPGRILDGMMTPTDIGNRLIIGGEFTRGGLAAGQGAASATNLVGYDVSAVAQNPAANNPIPTLNRRFVPMLNAGPDVNGTAMVVNALTTWVRPVNMGGMVSAGMAPELVIGGQFLNNGIPLGAVQTLTSATTQAGSGGEYTVELITDGPVRALTVGNQNAIGFAPGSNADGTAALFSAVHVGGSFTQAVDPEAANPQPFDATGVLRLRFDLRQMPPPRWEVLGPGTGVETGGEVFALGLANDSLPGLWDRGERPGTRLALGLTGTQESGLNTEIEVYDSNFTLIYTNQTIDPPFNDPSGALDPSGPARAGPIANMQLQGPMVWGGEVYYIVVKAQGGGSTGRYELTVSTDIQAPKIDETQNDGQFPDDISGLSQPPGRGQFGNAPEIVLGQNGESYRDPLRPVTQTTQPNAYTIRQFLTTPSGATRFELSDPPVLSRVFDTHLYQVRAPNDGTIEIRIATKNIVRGYQEIIETPTMQQLLPQSKRLNSPLRGAIRVFNNDFAQVGYATGTPNVTGLEDTFQYHNENPNELPPEDGIRTFTQDDPRIVINVRRGNTYFIQIESAYLGTFEANPDLVDWRFATGAYDLVLRATPALNGVDDHWPNSPNFGVDLRNGTPFPVDPTTGQGTISGVIANIPSGPFVNPTDIDQFEYVAAGRGPVTLTITPTSPTLAARIRVFDITNIVIATSAGGAGVGTQVQFQAQQGQRFTIAVDAGTTQGGYQLNISGPVQADDFPNSAVSGTNDTSNPVIGWANAKPLELNRFTGTYGLPISTPGSSIDAGRGNIEHQADEDIFKFTAENYEIATVLVNRIDATLNPFVSVYEVSADAVGLPVFYRIAFNDDAEAGVNTNSSVGFSVTPGRDYYIVVKGSNPDLDFGRYTVAVSVAPTDDHPNRNDFPLGTTINLAFDNLNFTSSGGVAGKIELNTDTDLFRFTAPANGSATVTLARSAGSTLGLDLVVLDQNDNALAGVTFMTTATSIVATLPTIVQGTQYFLQVKSANPLPMGATDTGAYTLNVSTLPSDDFPNAGQFNIAATIPVNTTSGVGTQPGLLVPAGDTDLFKFASLAQGSITVRITTPNSTLNPKVTIFSSTQTQLFTVNGNGDTAQIIFNATAAAEQFFILVSAADGTSGATAVGAYTVNIVATLPGGGGGGQGPDDYPNAGEFNDAPTVGLDTRTGAGTVNALINYAGDTDLFKFVASGAGQVDIQLITPVGGLVDGQIKIFNAARTLVFQDSAGLPGSSASVRFNAAAGDSFFVLVEPVGAATGSYSVRIATQPAVNYLYFPEGFAGSTIDEFVPLVNTNSTSVDYEIYARYESGNNPNTPIATGTLAPNSRGGVTISTRGNQAGSLVRIGEPYALEIRSTKKIGATFSHYDFNASVGESFTDRTSTIWTFAEGNKDRNAYRDFLLFYNPGNVQANVTITLYYTNGQTTVVTQSIDALRRGGINIDTDSRIPVSGKFGIKITSDQPIVSSLTSYRVGSARGGDGLLGDADGGSTRGVVGNISAGAGVTSTFNILNTNSTPATVTFTANYGRLDIPNLVRVLTIPAGTNRNFNLATLGLLPGQTAGLTYTSSIPVTFQAWEYKFGDGGTSTTATIASREYVFGDLFVNPVQAGIKYIEQLGLHNPTGVAQNIAVKFLFTDGTTSTINVNVNAGSFQFVQIDQQQAILSKLIPTAFSLQVSASSPIVASLTHYDLFLNGGWTAVGATVGLTNPLSSIS